MSEGTFLHFGLIVSGRGEAQFLPRLLRALTADGRCTLAVLSRIGQTSPRQEASLSKQDRQGKTIPNRDEEWAIWARAYLSPPLEGDRPDRFVLLVDDLESVRAANQQAVYDRYRLALDTILRPRALEARAAVHFLVMMLEAYYFGHAAAINAVLGLDLADEPGDVEAIEHPKNKLKTLYKGFDEVKHGRQIVDRLDLAHVLSNPTTCASLRTLVAWCQKAKGVLFGDEFRLADGRLSDVTQGQLDALPG